MEVLLLFGSPHLNGTTNALTNAFINGAEQAGHHVTRINCAQLNLHPCLGCNYCRQHDGKCVHGDDMEQLYPLLRQAEVMALVTPLYFFGMSAQLKMVIDRLYAINKELRQTQRKSVLLAAGGDSDGWAMDGLKSHYEVLCRYMHWSDLGQVLAFGASTAADLEQGDALIKAELLGKYL